MKFITWLLAATLFLLVFLPFYFIGFVAVPMGLLFCTAHSTRLPIIFWAWDNETGINGTIGGNNPKWPRICAAAGRKETDFLSRFIWLAWRNPCSNVGRHLLSAKPDSIWQRYTYEWHYSKDKMFQHIWGWKLSTHQEDGVTVYDNRKKFFFRISPYRAYLPGEPMKGQ
jgi:hypothetical protein